MYIYIMYIYIYILCMVIYVYVPNYTYSTLMLEVLSFKSSETKTPWSSNPISRFHWENKESLGFIVVYCGLLWFMFHFHLLGLLLFNLCSPRNWFVTMCTSHYKDKLRLNTATYRCFSQLLWNKPWNPHEIPQKTVIKFLWNAHYILIFVFAR